MHFNFKISAHRSLLELVARKILVMAVAMHNVSICEI